MIVCAVLREWLVIDTISGSVRPDSASNVTVVRGADRPRFHAQCRGVENQFQDSAIGQAADRPTSRHADLKLSWSIALERLTAIRVSAAGTMPS
jgi:hypothetical protein